MSIESAKAFLEKMKTDKAFFEKIAACKDATARMELVKAEGFDFSADEIKKIKKDELSPEELATVSGGSTFCFMKCDITCDTMKDRCVDCPDIS